MDALLSDICIGTSAASTYLPAHYFETKDPSGKVREFNLIDGGVAANNPKLASGDMVDLHIPTVSQSLHSEENYLRIPDDTLTGTLSSVDAATEENLENLVKVGEELLKKPVSRVNLGTGVFEPVDNMTNEVALMKIAKLLSGEKHLRESCGKASTPK